MKAVRYLSFLLLPMLLGATLLAAEQLWTCGMHPQIIKKEPGNCPVCGMKLTPIRSNAAKATPSTGERKVKYYKSTMMPGEVKPSPGKDSMGMDMVPVYEDEDSSAQNQIQIDAATVQRMNLRTAIVTRGPVKREIRTVGTVAYDEQGFRDITTKYEGWLEKLYVNTTWSAVKAGDPLFEIYSPELYNAQLNYLLALRSEKEEGQLTRAALARLQLFDLPEDLIAELKRTGEARRQTVFRAPANGVVVEKMGVVGQMMKPGERIYRLADLSSVWVQAQVYEKDLPFLHSGQQAVIRTSYGPERVFSGSVSLVLPQVEEQTRAATARIVLANSDGFLRPGMFVEVTFSSQLSADAVLVPDTAVLRSGERNTVFVALDGGFFEPRDVRLGARSEGGLYEVIEGLKAGERVVTSGQFMLDSESQLREAIQKMLRPAEGTPPAKSAEIAPKASPPASEAHAAPETLGNLAFASADAALALAKDDLAAYQAQLPALRLTLDKHLSADPHSVHGPLGAIKDSLSDPADIKSARKAFATFSTAVADVVRTDSAVSVPGLWVFECSMAKARWLQRDNETKNPFYGEGMLTCGEVVAEPKPSASTKARPLDATSLAAGLPPGHPPIGSAMSVRDYLLAAVATTSGPGGQKADGACGSCGMTAEAMAAGEPCEHAKN